MTAVTFDTHAFIKRLKDKGLPEAQAEAIVEVVRDVREDSLLEAATKADLRALELSGKADLREMELRLKLHLGTMIVALGGVLIAVKYFG